MSSTARVWLGERVHLPFAETGAACWQIDSTPGSPENASVQSKVNEASMRPLGFDHQTTQEHPTCSSRRKKGEYRTVRTRRLFQSVGRKRRRETGTCLSRSPC